MNDVDDGRITNEMIEKYIPVNNRLLSKQWIWNFNDSVDKWFEQYS